MNVSGVRLTDELVALLMGQVEWAPDFGMQEELSMTQILRAVYDALPAKTTQQGETK